MIRSSVNECLRGCTIAAIDGGKRTPAPAFEGAALCPRCLARVGWHLGDAAYVASRARAALVPSLEGGGERVSGTREPGSPLSIAAMEACDGIVSFLAGWTVYWASVAGITPPSPLSGALDGTRVVIGVQAGSDPKDVHVTVSRWHWWLKTHLWRYQHDSHMVKFHDDLQSTIGRAAKAFPDIGERVIEQRPRYCPVCGMQKVWMSWRDQVGDPIVRCRSCGWIFETDWGVVFDAVGISRGGEAR